MATYVLIHGAWHGRWCWRDVEDELRARGQDAISMDLPVDRPGATFADYAEVVLDAVPADADDLVVVGHSLGSMVVPLVAGARPVVASVSLCGPVPNPEGPLWDGALRTKGPGSAGAVRADDRGLLRWHDEQAAIDCFYADCEPEVAHWAYSQLRPQDLGLLAAPYPLDAVPPGPRMAIVGVDDAMLDIDEARESCRARLGADPTELPGGHSPFLARPAALADALVEIVRS
jgi:pimeloyl-ACP methyl ester carboxylesterase